MLSRFSCGAAALGYMKFIKREIARIQFHHRLLRTNANDPVVTGIGRDIRM